MREIPLLAKPAGRAFVFLAVWTLPLTGQYGDARRGAELIERRNCTLCHIIRGAGGSIAPDLSRRSTKPFTPTTMAAAMWNHGPVMWRAMADRNLEVPALGTTDMADLNEAAGAAADPTICGRCDRVVTGDSCDNTHGADARRARTP